MEEQGRYKRKRNPLVEKQSQVFLSLVIISYLVAYTIIFLLFIFLPSAITIDEPGGTVMSRFEAGREFLFLDQRVVPYLIVVMAALGMHFLFLTHRIFGPLVRFRRMLTAWPDGHWPRMFIKRRKDFHGDLFNSFNHSITKIEGDMRNSHELMGLALEGIRRAGVSRSPAPEVLKEAEERCLAAVNSLDKYFPPRRSSDR